jgi:hypothetical protein
LQTVDAQTGIPQATAPRGESRFSHATDRDPGRPRSEEAGVPWLVIQSKNGRVSDGAPSLADVLGLKFPTEAEVRRAAYVLQGVSRDSPLRSQIEISPGSIRFRRAVPADKDDEPAKPSDGSKEVRSWTAKSRRQMTRSFAALDAAPMYESGRLPVMVTLTYPGDWLAVAPDGEAVQRHFAMFARRWRRAWAEPLVCLWKREFQRRGAPHLHLYATQPGGLAGEGRRARYEAELLAWQAAGKCGRKPRWRPAAGDGLRLTQWVAEAWADIVNHPDPDQRAAMVKAATQVSVKEAAKYKDPKRLSVYFAKHGLYRDKEYQNVPPAEWDGKPVGRFWGHIGLPFLIATALIDGGKDYQLAKRTMRRWSARARVWDPEARRYRYVKAMRVKSKPTDARPGRKVRRPVNRLAGASGSLCLNDAPAVAADLARLIAMTTDHDQDVNDARRKAVNDRWRRPDPMQDQDFLCETCGVVHPLHEHSRCRERA